jgi:hypothetical protein
MLDLSTALLIDSIGMSNNRFWCTSLRVKVAQNGGKVDTSLSRRLEKVLVLVTLFAIKNVAFLDVYE